MCKKIFERMRLIKKIIVVFLISAVFCSSVFTSSEYFPVVAKSSIQTELENKQAELKKLENALAQAKKDKADILAKIEENKGKLNALFIKKSELEASIGYSESEIELIEQLVEGYSEHVLELEKNIEASEVLRKEKISQLCSVLKFIYENKNVSSLEMFFSSDSFSAYIAKRDHAQNIVSFQKTVIAEIDEATADTVQSKADYEEAKTSLEGYITLVEERKASIANEHVELENIILQLEEGTKLSEEEYNAIDSIEKEYASDIGQIKIDIEELSEYLSSQFRWPLNYNQNYYISSHFGYRNGPFAGYEHHNGVDIVVPYGTPILASSGGIVTRSEYASVFGNVVVISHGNGLQTLYCHASKRLVSVGDKVKQGDVIAKVGSTGNSTGNHLHFAFILNGAYVDPAKYVAKEYFK